MTGRKATIARVVTDDDQFPTTRCDDDDRVLCDFAGEPPLGRDVQVETFCDRPARWWGAGIGRWAGRLVFACHRHRGMLRPPEPDQ